MHKYTDIATYRLNQPRGRLSDNNINPPDIPGEENLLVPVLVEGDEVADVPVADVRLLRQHPRHEDVIHAEDAAVTVVINLVEGGWTFGTDYKVNNPCFLCTV